MRVLLATDSHDPSGVGEHMLTLASALAELAVEVKLLFPDHHAGQRLAQRGMALGISAQAVTDLAAAIHNADADIIHVHAGIGWEGHGLTAAVGQSGSAVVRTEHLPWLLTDQAQIAKYADAVQDVDVVISVSRLAAGGWRRAHARMSGWSLTVAAVPNGITPLPSFRKTGSDSTFTLLCVGRFTAQKRHRTLISALRRLRDRGVYVRLLLVGAGPLQDAIQRQVDRLGLTAQVEFMGIRDDVPALMAQSDLLVLPSAFEGLPLVVLEAMSAGLPVVGARIDGIAEALGDDHPWLVPSGSRALADAIAAALSDPDARAAVATAQADRFAKLFTAQRMAQDTFRIYRAAQKARFHRNYERTGQIMKLGFIGAGGIAHRHFGVLETMPDVSIVAVADPDQDRADEAAQRLGARAYKDHEQMLEAEELDAVYICVPPFAHGAPELACIAKGLPFFVEKPLSLDISLAEEIAAEVETAGLITAAGYHWRYLDTMDEARRHLEANPAHLMTGFWIDQTPPPRWWWREDASGGQVVEQATHIIDALRFLAGDVTEVFGMSARRDRPDFDGLTVPTATAGTLRFASGAIANLSATCLLRWNHRVGLHVFSDSLALEITDHDLMVDVGCGRPVHLAEGDPVWREDRDFVEAVMGRDNRIRCPYAEALETHRVALALSKSARTGAVVRMEGLRADPQPMFCQVFA